MNKNKLEYESPRCDIIITDLADIVTESGPDFDEGQSGLEFYEGW